MYSPLQLYSRDFDLEIDHPDHLKHIKEESKNYEGELMTPQECGIHTNKSTPRLEMR